MAEVLGADGTVAPGYETDRCVLREVDEVAVPLRWGDRDASELAGQSVRLRVHLRSSALYAVYAGQGRGA